MTGFEDTNGDTKDINSYIRLIRIADANTVTDQQLSTKMAIKGSIGFSQIRIN